VSEEVAPVRPEDTDMRPEDTELPDPEPADDDWEPQTPCGRPSTGPALAFGFNLAKLPDRGEDADPIVREGRDLGLIAVFDGMGGSGGTLYQTPQGPRTGAYLASRAARDVVEQRMVTLLDPEWNLDASAAALDLRRAVKEALAARLTELNAPPSGLRSRLIRALPTTMALLALQRRDRGGDTWACHALWAGDSRAYAFLPDSGAHQLTHDDLRDTGDAMTNLRQDSVVSNALSADTEFEIHHRTIELTAPFLVVAATDGGFGYLPTPMHFEHLVLTALRDSTDTDGWSRALQTSISQVAGDDASMAVLGIGADHAGFARLFTTRTAELQERWIDPLDALDAEIQQTQRQLDHLRDRQQTQQAQLWAQYRTGYEGRPGATARTTP